MAYRCEATSVAGFIQQLAVGYLGRGYYFYVLGQVPEGKDPKRVDDKLIEKYGIDIGKATRARRKALGLANVQYLRLRDRFVLLATPGKHEFFLHEAGQVKDAREIPLKLFGYSLSYRAGHPHVRIEQTQYLKLKSYLVDVAVHRRCEWLEEQFRLLSYEPYAPIRTQLHCILREVNKRRKIAGYQLVSPSCLRSRRRIVRPFENRTGASDEKTISIESGSCRHPE